MMLMNIACSFLWVSHRHEQFDINDIIHLIQQSVISYEV